MFLSLIRSRLLNNPVILYNLAKASYRISALKGFHALSKDCAANDIKFKLSSVNSFCSNTLEEVTLDDADVKTEEDNVLQAEYTEDEIKAILESGNPREIFKKKSQCRTVPLETSIRYMGSDAFQETYGDDPIWTKYRRNFKGGRPPTKTKDTCIHKNVLITSNPCPICRDEFLVIHYTNVKLLSNFICEYSGDVHTYTKTGVCMKKYQELLTAIYKAKNYGLIKYDVPFRKYNYEDYYPELKLPQKSSV